MIIVHLKNNVKSNFAQDQVKKVQFFSFSYQFTVMNFKCVASSISFCHFKDRHSW